MSKVIEYEEKDIESAIFVAEQLCFWTKKSPDIIKEYMYGDNVLITNLFEDNIFTLFAKDNNNKKMLNQIICVD